MEVSKCWKIVDFSKISVKMKNCKTFYETQTASSLQEMIHSSPSSVQSDKISLHLWNKHFLTEIYRNIQTFAFKLLQECSSWASRNGAVQMFFLTPNKYFCWKNGFWLHCGKILFSMPSELKRIKWVRFVAQNCIVNEWSLLLVFVGIKAFC